MPGTTGTTPTSATPSRGTCFVFLWLCVYIYICKPGAVAGRLAGWLAGWLGGWMG